MDSHAACEGISNGAITLPTGKSQPRPLPPMGKMSAVGTLVSFCIDLCVYIYVFGMVGMGRTCCG